MIEVRDIVEQLNLQVISDAGQSCPVTGGYASDLLSCVMAGAQEGNVWVTLQAHPNVIAVASLVGLAAVIITEGMQPDPETINRAHSENITVLCTAENTFCVVARLVALGISSC